MISVTSSADPMPLSGKSLIQAVYQTLPYDSERAAFVCQHNPFYGIRFVEEQPVLCGLCFFREGVESEIPGRIHQFKTLAENGNPETSPKMQAHLHVIMGLQPPRKGESLQAYRKRRTHLAREQYTVRNPFDHSKLVHLYNKEAFSRPAPRLFPVTSALWKLMGYQPPLARVLIEGVQGRTEREIAESLSTSVFDIYIRMAKAVRVGMGFIPNGDDEARTRTSSGRRRTGRSEANGTDESGLDDSESEG